MIKVIKFNFKTYIIITYKSIKQLLKLKKEKKRKTLNFHESTRLLKLIIDFAF